MMMFKCIGCGFDGKAEVDGLFPCGNDVCLKESEDEQQEVQEEE